jgi:hypothetical protein
MRTSSLIGFATLIAWVTSLHLLVPLPPQRIASWSQDSRTTARLVQEEAARTGLSVADVQRVLLLKTEREKEAIWVKWSALTVIVIAGIAAAVSALKNLGAWRFACAATSLLYLLGWIAVLSGIHVPEHQTLLDTYVSSLSNHFSAGFASTLAFVQKDVVAPLIHFLVAVFLFYERWQP